MFWDKLPRCGGCDYVLCFLDRTMDECPMCGHEIPEDQREEKA